MQEITKLKGFPIGIDDFKDLIVSNRYYIDKTLFIKEILDDISKVMLITRPRRFGKTLNLSMLKYFFEKANEDTSYLFKDLKIWQQGDKYTQHQGQYPVVFLSFKDVKKRNYENCYESLTIQVSEEFKRHDYILNSEKIRESDKRLFNEIVDGVASQVKFENSLKLLTRLLNEFHNKEVIILIDEYDTPINQGYLCGYYDDIIEFMRNFLCGGLKSNTSLKMGVITGVYRVAKESIFSGFNNLEVSTIIQDMFADKFGFVGGEVESILQYYGMEYKEVEVKDWYNGYIFGNDTVIYNPWSILNYVKQGILRPYWVNTSSNDIIRDIIGKTGKDSKKKIQMLMEGKEIEDAIINTDTNFRDIGENIIRENVLWNLLLVSGYLKHVNLRVIEGDTICSLKVPNKEILKLYRNIISSWFTVEDITGDTIKNMLHNLVTGELEEFTEEFEYLVRKTFSYFDVGEKSAENFYHAFILGMLVNLDGKYRVLSNRESGSGRPDVIIIPVDTSKKGVVIEFKVCDSTDDDKMKEKALAALEKVKNMNYKDEIINSGVQEIIEVVVVFSGKKVHVEWI